MRMFLIVVLIHFTEQRSKPLSRGRFSRQLGAFAAKLTHAVRYHDLFMPWFISIYIYMYIETYVHIYIYI